MKDQPLFKPIRTLRLSEVEPELYKQLYRLNFRSNGGMRNCLVGHRKANNAYVCYVLDQENNVAGWTLVYQTHNTIPAAHFYVRKKYRRKGLGTLLMQAALDTANEYYNSKLYYFPHDPQSTCFFKSCRDWGILNKTNDANSLYYG